MSTMMLVIQKPYEYFLAVAERGSFSQAARHLELDPSYLSKQIKRLEAELGIQLFTRTTRSLALTRAGEVFYQRLRQIESLDQELNSYVENAQHDMSGTVKITTVAHLDSLLILPMIHAVQARYPEIQFEVSYNDSMVNLVDQAFDLAIRVWKKPKDSSLIIAERREVKSVLVASPDFISRYGAPKQVEDLQHLPAAVYKNGPINRETLQYLDSQGQPQRLRLKAMYQANHVGSLLLSTLQGLCYTQAQDYMVAEHLQTGRLIRLLPTLDLPPEPTLWLVYPNRQLSPAVAYVLQALKARLKATKLGIA